MGSFFDDTRFNDINGDSSHYINLSSEDARAKDVFLNFSKRMHSIKEKYKSFKSKTGCYSFNIDKKISDIDFKIQDIKNFYSDVVVLYSNLSPVDFKKMINYENEIFERTCFDLNNKLNSLDSLIDLTIRNKMNNDSNIISKNNFSSEYDSNMSSKISAIKEGRFKRVSDEVLERDSKVDNFIRNYDSFKSNHDDSNSLYNIIKSIKDKKDNINEYDSNSSRHL